MSTKTDIWTAYLQKRGEYDAQSTILANMGTLKTKINDAIANIDNAITYYNNSYELFTTKGYIGGTESKSDATKKKITATREKLETLVADLRAELPSIESAITTQATTVNALKTEYETLFNQWSNTPDPVQTPTPTSTPSGTTPSSGSGNNNVPPPSGRGGTPGHHKPAALQDDRLLY